MKEKFKAFYELSEQELSEIWSDDETVIILDTSILLSFYEYSKNTQEEWFKILQIVKDHIWIPFHVALEYQRGRLSIIRREKLSLENFNTKLDGIKSTVTDGLSSFDFESKHPDLFNIEKKFRKDICSLVDSFKTEVTKVDETQPCATEYDDIRAKLDNLLEGKVGEEPEEAWVLQVAKQGVTRYDNKTPPGYMDAKKDGSSFTHNNIRYEGKFGDLIIWKQILEYLKGSSGVKNVIFITNDTKEDWCAILDISGVKHRIGARPELKSEIYKEAEVANFMMYNANEFLTAVKKYRSVDVEDKAIEETKHIFNVFDRYFDGTEQYKLDNTALSIVDKYRRDNDISAKLQGAMSLLEQYKLDNTALSIVDKYRRDNDVSAKLQGAMSLLEQYNLNNTTLSIAEKYMKDFNKASIINEMRNGIEDINDLDDDQL